MKRHTEIDRRTWIQRLMAEQKCCGGRYIEPSEGTRFEWPKMTWLKKRMAELKAKEAEK